VYKFKKRGSNKKEIFDLYINNTKYISNWDLVDVTCPNIVGEYLFDKDRFVLYSLANSNSIWERRIAIISTLRFIKNNEFKDTLEISKLLLHDEHDLIHKAVGWMLREVYKRDKQIIISFLNEYGSIMPRVMLRYAIEKMDNKLRLYYLHKGKKKSKL
jgi:3-methyladenine DNA glycosylase AlkD